MATKFENRIIGRLQSRLASRGLDAAVEYGLAVCGGHPHVKHAVLSSVQGPLKALLQAAIDARGESRKQDLRDEAAAREQAKQREREALQGVADQLEVARKLGQAAIFLSTLSPTDRTALKAPKAEVQAALVLRKTSLRSTKVKELLGCTDTELTRWSEDGRLPVLFRRRMPCGSAGTLDVRHWSESVIQDALGQLAAWRKEDTDAKKAARAANSAKRRARG